MVQINSLAWEVLNHKDATQTAISNRKMACLYVAVLAFAAYDVRYGHLSGQNMMWSIVMHGLLVFSVLVVFKVAVALIIRYWTFKPMEISKKQMSLLAVDDADISFKLATTSPPTSTKTSDVRMSLTSLFNATYHSNPLTPQGSLTPINMSANSWFSSSLGSPSAQPSFSSPSFCGSPNNFGNSLSPLSPPSHGNTSIGSIASSSWSFHQNDSALLETSQGNISAQIPDCLFYRRMTGNPNSPVIAAPLIEDQENLNEYLEQHRQMERMQIHRAEEESMKVGASVWGYSHYPDPTYGLSKNVFQLATKDPDQQPQSTSHATNTSATASLAYLTIWQKRNVTPEQLFQFTGNLRIWLSSNILEPIVQAIDEANKALLKSHSPDIQIGSVGIDKLRKTSGIKQLAYLHSFLEVTIHQDYLVHRLRELSHGGAMSAFTWNGGSAKFNGKPWKEDFPTDTIIILHLFSVYMDNMLPPDIQKIEGRPFSNDYVVKAPEKPHKVVTNPILYLCQVSPPHVKVVLPPDEELEVGGGRNNLLHALLLFLHHVVYMQHSCIGNVQLSMSGINVEWVVRPESR